MGHPVTVNNENEETVEISKTEYDMIKALGPAIAEQNVLVLSAVQEMIKGLAQLAGQLEQALAREPIVIPAPNVTVEAAKATELAPIISTTPPDVIVNLPMEKTRKTKGSFKRDKNGALSGWESTTE